MKYTSFSTFTIIRYLRYGKADRKGKFLKKLSVQEQLFLFLKSIKVRNLLINHFLKYAYQIIQR